MCSRRRGQSPLPAGLGSHRTLDRYPTHTHQKLEFQTEQKWGAVLHSDDGRNTVIRPLAYAREEDIARYASLREFPIIPCNLCGSQENLQRQVIKEMFQTWDKQHPGRLETMFRALCNVEPSHLADPELYDFREGRRLGGKRQAVQTAEPQQDFGRLDVLNL